MCAGPCEPTQAQGDKSQRRVLGSESSSEMSPSGHPGVELEWPTFLVGPELVSCQERKPHRFNVSVASWGPR